MILHADALNMPLADCSVDAIVTDPPYGLEFMGKEWDRLMRKDRKVAYPSCRPGHGPDAYQAGYDMQLWHTQWLTEAYRVLKPGGSMLVMGGTRTFHRLMCAIEDSGFIIKDTLMWIYGSGFPKAQEASVLVDAKILGISTKEANRRRKKIREYEHPQRKGRKYHKTLGFNEGRERFEPQYITLPLTPEGEYWHGFKIGGIKPAYEPIVWAVKPPEGSYVDNVLKRGVGAVNVDECRIEGNPGDGHWGQASQKADRSPFSSGKERNEPYDGNPKGRFPANIILDEESARVMDEQSGRLRTGCGLKRKIDYDRPGKMLSKWQGRPETVNRINNEYGGASRFFYCAKASRSERNAGLEGMPNREAQRYGKRGQGSLLQQTPQDKIIDKNVHPCVKPIALFEWLIKLITREGQTVLDPFLGSGTTAISAHNTGRKCIGIEKEREYIEIAKGRTAYHESQPRQMEMRV